MKKRINAAILTLILALSLAAVMPTLQALADEPIVTVNGVAISKEQYYELLSRKYGAYAIDELIDRELVRQKAEEYGAAVDEEAFAEIMDIIQQQLGGAIGLQQFLQQNRVTYEEFEDQMRWNALLSELAKAEVSVTDEELEAWFVENRGYFDQEEMVEVSHILVDTEEEAQEVLAALAAGEDFEALAQEWSLDPQSAIQGGYIGYITLGVTVPGFEEVAFSLPVGEYGLGESQFGWHIILVHDRVEAEEAVFADNYENALEAYLNLNALDPQTYLQKLRQEAQISVFPVTN